MPTQRSGAPADPAALAGPLVVGAVQAGRVGVAAAGGVPAAGHPLGEGAGQREADGGEAGRDASGAGLLGRGGRHAPIFVEYGLMPYHTGGGPGNGSAYWIPPYQPQ